MGQRTQPVEDIKKYRANAADLHANLKDIFAKSESIKGYLTPVTDLKYPSNLSSHHLYTIDENAVQTQMDGPTNLKNEVSQLIMKSKEVVSTD